MAGWTFVLARPSGDALVEFTTAQGKTLKFSRNGVPEANLSIALEDDAAQLLLNSLANDGIPLMRAYRNGTLRFNGYLAPFQEEAEESSSMALTFRGPFGRLLGDGEGGGRFTSSSVTFSVATDDAGQIAKSLIDTTNTESATGIVTTGTIEATKKRDRTYEYANVGEAVVNLTNVLDGFDFEVKPLNSGTTTGQFVVYARQGSEQIASVFEYGETTLANVRSVQRLTRPPVNAARVLGADGLTGYKTDAASISKYDMFMRQVAASDVSEQTTLDDKAQALLRPDPIRVVSFAPEPALAPSPWDDYWLGDTVTIRARRGAMVFDDPVRVNEITVVVDDDGQEVAEIPDPSSPGDEAMLRAELIGSEAVA